MSGVRLRMTMGALLITMLLACSTLIVTPPHVRQYGDKKVGGPGGKGEGQDILTAEEDAQNARDAEKARLSDKPIDLTLYVVFHKQLHDQLYSELKVPLLPAPEGEAKKAYRPNAVLHNGNEVVFLATNPNITKRYNTSNPLYEGRVVNEWELPGYSRHIGAKLNEYGAMGSVFASNWSSPAGRPPPHESSGPLPEEWIGFLQYDMRIDSQLIQRIRRRIAQKGNPPNPKPLIERRKKTKPVNCCVFSGVVYPAQYLLHNAMGQMILDRYNSFFKTSRTLTELPAMATLDMFIVPAAEFNRFMPFLQSLMDDLVLRRKRFPDPSVPLSALIPSNNTGAEGVRWRRAKALEVMEGALAIALAYAPDMRHVQIPVRHGKIIDTDTSTADDFY